MTFQGLPRGVLYSIGASLLFFSSAHAQQWDWVKRFSGDSSGTAVAVDNGGNACVAGVFAGTNTFGEKEFVSAGGNDVFLLKLDSDGNVLWSLATGGLINDAIFRLAYGSNGSLFLIGDFTLSAALLPESYPDRTRHLDHVYLARMDGGKFTWVNTNIYPTSLTMVPDGTMRVAGYWDGMVSARFSENGDLLALQRIPTNQMHGAKIVTDSHGNIFGAKTFFSEPFFTGSNVIAAEYYGLPIVSGLGDEGIRWFWPAPRYDRAQTLDMIAAVDEGVITTTYMESRLPYRTTYVMKHGVDGDLRWLKWIGGGCSKNFWTATALNLAPNGDILVAGGANSCPVAAHYPNTVWLSRFDPNGNKIYDEQFDTHEEIIAPAPQLAIAADADGAVLMTGRAPRNLTYGTNVSYGGDAAFILRRSTFTPVLRTQSSGATNIFFWPRAAYPFALQQRDATGTNWSFVTNVPVRVGAHWQVELPAEADTSEYRLFRTNEAPIRYRARLQWNQPGGSYLGHTNVIVLHQGASTVSQTFSAYVTAGGPGTIISVDATDIESGVSLMPSRSYAITPYTPPYSFHVSCYCISINTGSFTFEPGQHRVAFNVSDGIDAFTNTVQFEVITFETALEELRPSLEALSTLEAGKRVSKLFEQALRAEERGRKKVALTLWTHFQRRLGRMRSISDDERNQLSVAASQLQALAGK